MATETHHTTDINPPNPSPAPAAAPVVPKGPRNYLVMLLLAVLLVPTGLARAYRGEQIGWTRFWIFVGVYGASFLLFWVPLLDILLGLASLALCVWGAVDVFQLYRTKTDADGESLVTTARDEKFAHALYIFFIVSLILSGVAILLAVIFGAIIFSVIMHNANNPQNPNYNNYNNNSQYLPEFQSYSN